jgi:hypothetical protein
MMSAKRSKPPDLPAYTLAALQLSDPLATALARLGTGRGDRVGIMPLNCPQHLISLQSFIRFHPKEE